MPKSHDRHPHEPARSAGTPRPVVDQAVMARLIEEIPVIAAAVRAARDRAGMLVALAPVTQTAAAEQAAFVLMLCAPLPSRPHPALMLMPARSVPLAAPARRLSPFRAYGGQEWPPYDPCMGAIYRAPTSAPL